MCLLGHMCKGMALVLIADQTSKHKGIGGMAGVNCQESALENVTVMCLSSSTTCLHVTALVFVISCPTNINIYHTCHYS